MPNVEPRCRVLFDLIEKDYRDNGRKSRMTLIQNLKHLEPFFAERSASRVTTSAVEEYKDERRKAGASPATVNLELAALKRAYNLAIDRELLTSKPRIKLFHLNNARRGFFEPREYRAMYEALRPELRNILRFAYLSGWRKGEILSLRWDVNFDDAGRTIRIFDSKSGEGRLLPLQGELLEVIQEQLEQRRPGCELIFHNEGQVWSKRIMHEQWTKACRVSGVNKHFHDLRRTAVRNLSRAGVPRAVAKKITGHKTDSVYERYDIVDEQDIRNSLERVADYLHKNGGEPKNDRVPNELSVSAEEGHALVSCRL